MPNNTVQYDIVSIPANILSAYYVYHLSECTDKKSNNNKKNRIDLKQVYNDNKTTT